MCGDASSSPLPTPSLGPISLQMFPPPPRPELIMKVTENLGLLCKANKNKTTAGRYLLVFLTSVVEPVRYFSALMEKNNRLWLLAYKFLTNSSQNFFLLLRC